MNITVTHTLAPEILALLQNLVKSQAIAEQLPAADFKPAAPVKPIKKVEPAAPVDNGTTEKITLEMVRAKAQEISKSGKREQVLALVESFGVDSLPKLDPLNFADFLTKLKAL